jgi:hypothetical protein
MSKKKGRKIGSTKRSSRVRDLLDDEAAETSTRRTTYSRVARGRYGSSGNLDVFRDVGGSSPYSQSEDSFSAVEDEDDKDYTD